MRNASLWGALLGVEKTVIESVEHDRDTGVVVVAVRAKGRGRCGRWGRAASWYDRGVGRRRWRSLDWGSVRVFVEADAGRVACPVHGPTVRQVPWARHGAGHTYVFEQQVAWLATQCSKSAVTRLMRITWRTVGAIIARVCADVDATVDRLAGLKRIGIDEVSYRKGQKYLTVVVDHDSGLLVWARAGRDSATVEAFFDDLGAERCAQLTHVSADAARWIARPVRERAPHAVLCADPFHVVAWATECLDEVRREVWNTARRAGGVRQITGPVGSLRHIAAGDARTIAHSRYALWKNPEDLTDHQRAKLAWIARASPRLHRAYLLKEALRYAFKVKGDAGCEALQRWISWAQRCRIAPFVHLAGKIKRNLPAIHATLNENLSNALVESVNTKIRLITRIAFGFHTPQPLIALALLSLGSYRPTLPGRT